MKFTTLFLVFTSILIIESLNSSILQKTLIQASKLQKLVCQIINNSSHFNNDTQDILIANFGGDNKSQEVNEIIECIGDDKALVISNLSRKHINPRLRKTAVIVMMIRNTDRVSLLGTQIINFYY